MRIRLIVTHGSDRNRSAGTANLLALPLPLQAVLVDVPANACLPSPRPGLRPGPCSVVESDSLDPLPPPHATLQIALLLPGTVAFPVSGVRHPLRQPSNVRA